MLSFRIVGPGRAGTSLAAALSARWLGLRRLPGSPRRPVRGRPRRRRAGARHPRRRHRRGGRQRWRPSGPPPWSTSRAPSGSTPWTPIPCGRRCTRLVPLPNGEVGAARLRSGVTFAVAGAPVAHAMVEALGGRLVEVADGDRAAYHAAACIAANHVVALLGQVERVAASVGLDLESFLPLTRAAVDDVDALGAAAALDRPGPAGRLGHAQPSPRRAARRASGPATRPAPRWRPGWPGRPYRRRCSGDGRRRDEGSLADPARCRPGHRPDRRPRAHHGGAPRRARVAAWRGPGPSATWWR